MLVAFLFNINCYVVSGVQYAWLVLKSSVMKQHWRLHNPNILRIISTVIKEGTMRSAMNITWWYWIAITVHVYASGKLSGSATQRFTYGVNCFFYWRTKSCHKHSAWAFVPYMKHLHFKITKEQNKVINFCVSQKVFCKKIYLFHKKSPWFKLFSL